MSKKTNFKYSIFINQKAIIDNNIDIALDEAVILSHFMDLKASSSMHTIIDENKEWMWVSHSKILNDLPMLGIKTAQSVINKINRLIELGFIEKYSKNINKKRSYYALTNKCALLLYDNNATLKNNLGSDIHPKENFSVNDKNNLGSTLKNNLGDYTISKDYSINDKEKEFKNSNPPPKKEKIDFDLISSWYKEYCPKQPQIRGINPPRKKKIQIKLKEMDNDLSIIKEIFEKGGKLAFLNGENNRGWKANFDWYFSNDKNGQSNWINILEGKYESEVNKDKPKKRHSELTNPDITGGKNDYVSMFKN